MIISGKPQLNRKMNRSLILDRVRIDRRISRARLATSTNLRPPTITTIVRDLLEEGLLIETGIGATNSGRAPRMLELRCDRPIAMGFEITHTSVYGGLCDLKGQLHASLTRPLRPTSPEATLDVLTDMAQSMFAEVNKANGHTPITWSSLSGAGIGLPGMIDSRTKTVVWSHPLLWRDVALGELCQQRWGIETDILNDSAAGCLSAHYFGEEPVENMIYIVLRFADAMNCVVGIGTSLIIHGEPYHGEFGSAGEVTEPIAHPLTDALADTGRPYPDTTAFTKGLLSGHPSAVEAMDRVGNEIASFVVQAINLLEPGRVIIESDVPELGRELQVRLDRICGKRELHDKTEIVLANVGEFGGVTGAVVPTLKRMFTPPRVRSSQGRSNGGVSDDRVR